jgi:hypothetical protein
MNDSHFERISSRVPPNPKYLVVEGFAVGPIGDPIFSVLLWPTPDCRKIVALRRIRERQRRDARWLGW